MRARRLAKWLLTSPFVLTEDTTDTNWFRAQALTPTLSQRQREKICPHHLSVCSRSFLVLESFRQIENQIEFRGSPDLQRSGLRVWAFPIADLSS